MKQPHLLEVYNLNKSYPAGRRGLFGKRNVQVLTGVDFSIRRGEVLGLVGESGSGKSTIGKAILRLVDSQADAMRFGATDLTIANADQMRRLRKDMQIIFQDPYASLDPRKSIRAVLCEALDTHHLHEGKARQARLEALMDMVGLRTEFLDRMPHEFSGGQRQRISIARALAVEPKFIVADEAVSALDVSIQAQILNLLADLRARTGVSLLFISHDLSVVRYISDRVMVLYLGRVMEVGSSRTIHKSPRHPYTAALVQAEPKLNRTSNHIQLKGEIPSILNPPSGCVFRSRCPYALAECASANPKLRQLGEDHFTACIRDDILQG